MVCYVVQLCHGLEVLWVSVGQSQCSCMVQPWQVLQRQCLMLLVQHWMVLQVQWASGLVWQAQIYGWHQCSAPWHDHMSANMYHNHRWWWGMNFADKSLQQLGGDISFWHWAIWRQTVQYKVRASHVNLFSVVCTLHCQHASSSSLVHPPCSGQ